ncbi:hypothetical protein [Pseudonocardia sp. GCM10023141]|uniref:hypothetical protein n=1 Tax=Pseudonocardia sp. GCM10023141 TaxID=3252653 RepID=UPI00360AFC94
MDLLALDDVRRRLRIVGQTYDGLRSIEVVRIVGSLDRSSDFDRDFRPRLRRSQQRLASLREAFPEGKMPPIEAFEVGGAFFVSDGHHRVALARQDDVDFIDADVTVLETNYTIPPDVDVRQLVHTEQQRRLLTESGLAAARPDVVIEFSRTGGYPELLELIKAHGYDLARRRGALPEPAEVAADWYDTVFAPGVAALQRESLPASYSYKTDADLFLWIYQRRRSLQVLNPAADFDAAARDAHGQRVSRRFRKEFLRERSTPLPQRD